MRLGAVRLVRRAVADGRPRSDEGRAIALLRIVQCLVDRVRIVPIDRDRLPPGRGEACRLIGAVGQGKRAVDRDLVVVPDHDELVQLQVARKRDRFLTDALHQVAVRRQNEGVVIDDIVAILLVQSGLRDGHANGGRDALAQRPRGRLDPGSVTVFRMSGSLGTDLTKVPDLIERDVLVPEQEQGRVEQHGAVAGRQDEAIAVRPVRMVRIELHVLRQQNGGDVGRTHRQARVARIGRFHRVDR